MVFLNFGTYQLLNSLSKFSSRKGHKNTDVKRENLESVKKKRVSGIVLFEVGGLHMVWNG